MFTEHNMLQSRRDGGVGPWGTLVTSKPLVFLLDVGDMYGNMSVNYFFCSFTYHAMVLYLER